MMFLIEEHRQNNQEGLYFSRELSERDIEFTNSQLSNCCFTIGKRKINFPDGIFTYESTPDKQMIKIKQTIKFLIKHFIGLEVNGKICISFLSLEGCEEYFLNVHESRCFMQERLLSFSEEKSF